MKHLFGRSIATAIAVAAVGFSVNAEPSSSGIVDFGKLMAPTSGGEFVEVNVSSNVISLISRLAKDNEPEIKDVIAGLQQVRVNVVGLDDGNRDQMKERVKSVRGQLDGQGWERVVTAQEKDEDVAIFIKTKGSESVQGIVVTVISGDKEAVLVNVVGDIQPDKLALIGQKFNIDPLKHLPPFAKK
jgi:hypothetical protein